MRPLLLLPLLLLAACASSDGGGSGGARTDSDALAPPAADHDLAVRLDLGDGSAPQTWTLTCAGAAGGTHPQAEQACARLKGIEDPFAPLPADRLCTQQYGGPQTARVTGTWDGRPVDVALSRSDGCVIAQWDSLVPLVPDASS